MDAPLSPIEVPMPLVREAFFCEQMHPQKWEYLLANGWRHNGHLVYRTSEEFGENDALLNVMPLRYDLNRFELTKKQQKIWRQNSDLTCFLHPLSIRDDIEALFAQHASRFKYQIPSSVYDFVTGTDKPFPTYQFEIYKADKLIALTFVDLTSYAISSTYAMFDLNESKRSLGHFSMILEMVYAKSKHRLWHYPGYAHREPSHMDYKKQYAGAEYLDWQAWQWIDLPYASDSVGTPLYGAH